MKVKQLVTTESECRRLCSGRPGGAKAGSSGTGASISKKCYREGIHTRNPFFNFLRKYRKEHCGLSILEIAKQGAAEWRKMEDKAKWEFIVEAFRTKRVYRRRRSRRNHSYVCKI